MGGCKTHLGGRKPIWVGVKPIWVGVKPTPTLFNLTAMQLVIDTPGVTIRYHNASFVMEDLNGTKIELSPDKITGIAIKTSDCALYSGAVMLAAEKNIPILFFGKYGAVKATLRSPHFTGLSDLRRRQAMFIFHPEAVPWLVRLFSIKLEGQLEVLAFLSKSKPDAEKEILGTMEKMKQMSRGFEEVTAGKVFSHSGEVAATLMGIEGSIAREYWGMLSKVMPEEWKFGGRSRRPALDGFNAVLNYLYGMTYPVVESALFSAGLDPYLGVLHADEYDSPSLAFDCIEPFRPWVDELVLTQFLNGYVNRDMFTIGEAAEGWSLNHIGKRFWIPLYNDFLKDQCFFGHKRVKRETHIYRFAGELTLLLKSLNL